jgi:GNAT superfamily N-acetyltransferase
MTGVRVADNAETLQWSMARAERIRSWFGRFAHSDAWIEHEVARRLTTDPAAPVQTHVISDGGSDVGIVAVRLVPGEGAAIIDIWIEPEHRGQGLGRFARLWAEDWARAKPGADALFVTIDPDDPAQAGLFASYPVRAQTMMKRLEPPAALPAGVVGRPMSEDEFVAWHDATVIGYAGSIAGSGVMSLEDAMVRSRTQADELLPDGVHTAGHSFWSIDADGEQVATNWLRHAYEPGTSFVFGVAAHDGHRGKGYGRAAMSVGEQAAIGAGDTHLELNVFGQNTVAINLYTAMGYAIVMQNRSIHL